MTSAKKILYITPGLNIGGAEKFTITLANALSAETTRQTIVSLNPQNDLQSELNGNIQFVALHRRYKFDLVPVHQLRKLIRAEKPDVIFCINFFAYFFARCACFLLREKSKWIISYHSTIHVHQKAYLLHRLYRRLLTKRDQIITVSHNQAKYTADKVGIPLSRFKTIHNGIDTNFWRLPGEGDDTRYKIRAAYHIPSDARVIIKAATFRIEKNHLGAVKALHLLHTVHHCKAYLLLAGDGLMKNDVKKLAIELGLGDYVVFAGMQKNVQPFYWASDIFTLCSNAVETFSIAALEAMASGLPCVLTDIGGAREMIVEGQNGYLCTPDEKDIAEKWLEALNGHFPKERIYNHIINHFSANKMIEEYKKML